MTQHMTPEDTWDDAHEDVSRLPFACTECVRTFATYASCLTHIRTHYATGTA